MEHRLQRTRQLSARIQEHEPSRLGREQITTHSAGAGARHATPLAQQSAYGAVTFSAGRF